MLFLLNPKIQLKRNSHVNFTKKKRNVYGVVFIRGMFKRVASASKNTYNLYKDFSNENPLTVTFVIEHGGEFLGIADHLGFVAGAEIIWRKELKKKVLPVLKETLPPYVEQFQDILFSDTLLSPLPLATLALTGLAVYSVGEELNENYITTVRSI